MQFLKNLFNRQLERSVRCVAKSYAKQYPGCTIEISIRVIPAGLNQFGKELIDVVAIQSEGLDHMPGHMGLSK